MNKKKAVIIIGIILGILGLAAFLYVPQTIKAIELMETQIEPVNPSLVSDTLQSEGVTFNVRSVGNPAVGQNNIIEINIINNAGSSVCIKQIDVNASTVWSGEQCINTGSSFDLPVNYVPTIESTYPIRVYYTLGGETKILT